jgi:hypothetical protein
MGENNQATGKSHLAIVKVVELYALANAIKRPI